MIRRLFLGLAAAAAFAAAAAVLVFALAFALYALAEPYAGRAGAAAILAGVTALLMAVTALLIGRAARPRKRDLPASAGSVVDRAFRFLKDNPAVAISAAVGRDSWRYATRATSARRSGLSSKTAMRAGIAVAADGHR